MAEKLPMFEFKTASGDLVSIRKFSSLPGKAFRKIRKLDVADQMFTILEDYASKEALTILDELPMEEFNEFTRAWQADSGVSVGKS